MVTMLVFLPLNEKTSDLLLSSPPHLLPAPGARDSLCTKQYRGLPGS